MKKLFLAILAALIMLSPLNGETQKRMRDLKPLSYPSHLQTLSLSASSLTSYEDAMNRFSRIKPAGYVVESIKYLRVRGEYVVSVKLRKV